MSRVGVWGLALTLCAGPLSACGVLRAETSAELEGYRIGPGTNQITLIYGSRPADDPGAAEVLSQDAAEVKVRALYRRAEGKQEDLLRYKEIVVTLQTPLGEPRVLDEDGQVVIRRP